MARANAMARTAPLTWPSTDELLPRLLGDASLVEIASPIFTPCALDNKELEGPGRSYVRICPKFEVRAFRPRAWSPEAGPGALRMRGAVYFSKAAAGAPGCVHGGALSTALDIIVSEMSMRDGGYTAIYVTQSLTVTFAKFVPLDSVCGFESWIEPGPEAGAAGTSPPRRATCLVRCRLLGQGAPAATLAECRCVMAAAGPLPPGLRQRVEYFDAAEASGRPREPALLEMPVPASDGGWWPPAARAIAARLVNAEPRLEVADMDRDFPAMRGNSVAVYASPPGQSLWDFAPGTAVRFDVGREGASADLAGGAVKVVRQLLWRGAEDAAPGALGLAGVVLFTENSMGPPGRAHGGAVATAFDDAMGYCCVRQLGFLPAWNTVELSVEYLRATPLSKPLLIAARVSEREGRSARTEALLLAAEAWPPPGLGDPWAAGRERPGPSVLARASARWRQARPESVGLEAAISYDEALERFGGPDGSGTPEAVQQAQGKLWESRARL